ncbi:MAG: glycoside hydrolase family 43 protein [Prevotella sp.]|nr:glycoside hydrolase family 43 protein [Prevotella sp.]MCH4182802.1 glycoside hydrolase family 43 protein [Prevotella sp.]MCH4211248.1 glycoside hydrolase family 43 protein [Prevotella sp.]MCH4241248.1 glycoside hydrolase family 43 protein [Prevotella sp.]
MCIKKLMVLTLMMVTCSLMSAEKVPSEKDMGAYLFTYFTDATHSLFMGISYDGYSFTAVNGGKPVIAGDSVAEQHGIRDPHIYRAPNGCFYMAMTDLHIYAQKLGLRSTLWERSDKYGWGNNRGLVLMSSKDLIHWSHTEIRFDKVFPDELNDICCVWAPETIWDPETKQLMLYFTMRKNPSDICHLYYVYVNDNFTKLTSRPKLLFQFEDPKVPTIDADICPMPDGRYFMTYVAQENPAGIRYAISRYINRGYVTTSPQIDTEKGGCEAPQTWKRIGQNKWVTMYDIYSIHPHNFGFVETSDFEHFKPLGRFNEGVMKATNFVSPKHGSVIQITKREAQRLIRYWQKH